MKFAYRPLFSLEVTHDYHGGAIASDVSIEIAPETVRLLRQARLLAKAVDRRMHVLFEAGSDGNPIVAMPRQPLRFLLRPLNCCFANFTSLDDAAPLVTLHHNRDNPTTLAIERVARQTSRFEHPLVIKKRPCEVSLVNSGGETVATQTLSDPEPTSVFFDTVGQVPGIYTITEKAGSTVKRSVAGYIDPESARDSLLGVVEIHPFVAAAAPQFRVAFQSRQEILSFYVVARGFRPDEFAAFKIVDAGFTQDERPEIKFDRISADQLGAGDLPASSLAVNGSQVVLFRSRQKVPRLAAGMRKIQLSRSTEVLIENLSLPSPYQSTADVIVPISKTA